MLRTSLSIICLLALTAASTSAPRSKRAEPKPAPRERVQEQDEFRSCDVAVREFVHGRKEAAALVVKEVKADGLRMTLNFIHPYGESGDTPPNLGFTRGESVEDRRKSLNDAKQRIRMLSEAARSGNVWYVIALSNDNPDKENTKRSPVSLQADENRGSASAAVFANIENRCVNVQDYKAVPVEGLSRELRTFLGEKEPQPTHSGEATAAPPS